MKKMNNKGFLLVESLVVTTFVLTVLVFLFVQFKNLFNSYEDSYDYNTVEGIYNLNTMKEYIIANETSPNALQAKRGGSTYLVIFQDGTCNANIADAVNLSGCDDLANAMNLKTLIYAVDDPKTIDTSDTNIFTTSYKTFLNRLETQGSNNRLIGQFEDGTYATITYDDVATPISGGIMKSWGSSSNEDFHTYKSKSSITSVVFEDDVTSAPDKAIDISEKGDKSVLYWITDNMTLHIGGNGGVTANYNSSYMFAGFTALETVDFNNLNTNLVINAEGMFQGCSKLKTIKDLILTKVTNTSKMFQNCTSLTSETLDLSGLNTTKVTDMSYMFAGSSLSNLDLSNFKTENVTTMNSMFAGCSSLATLNIDGFDTRKVINMENMFNGTAFTELDLCSFDTRKVKKIDGIFSDMKNLDIVKVSDKWQVSEDANIFDGSKITEVTTGQC